jgi:hypothetical protein
MRSFCSPALQLVALESSDLSWRQLGLQSSKTKKPQAETSDTSQEPKAIFEHGGTTVGLVFTPVQFSILVTTSSKSDDHWHALLW